MNTSMMTPSQLTSALPRIALAVTIAGAFFYAASAVDPGATEARTSLAGPGPIEASSSAEAAVTDVIYPTLGSIESRHQTIVIEATPAGPRYTVLDVDGQTLAEHLTLEEHAEQFPENPVKGAGELDVYSLAIADDI